MGEVTKRLASTIPLPHSIVICLSYVHFKCFLTLLWKLFKVEIVFCAYYYNISIFIANVFDNSILQGGIKIKSKAKFFILFDLLQLIIIETISLSQVWNSSSS